MIEYVYLPSRRSRLVRSQENYRGRYKIRGMATIADVPLFTTDKRVAEQALAEIVREAQQESAGIVAPRALRDAAAKPLSAHLADCVADLKAKGRAKKYYGLISVRGAAAVLDSCGWVYPKDVTPDSFVAWRLPSIRGRWRPLRRSTITTMLPAFC